MSKLITNDVLEKVVTDVVTDLSEHMHDIEEYTEDEILALFDLSVEEATELTKVINDNLLATNKVYSNKKTEERLAEIQAEMSAHVSEQIANSGNLKRKIVASEADVTEETFLYLILEDADNNTYGQYMLIDGTVANLGSTTVDLEGYVLEEDLNTTLEDYAKANEVLNADKVVNDLSSVSNDTVLSTQGISDTLEDYLPLTGGTVDGRITAKHIDVDYGTGTISRLIQYEGKTYVRNYVSENEYSDITIKPDTVSFHQKTASDFKTYDMLHSGYITTNISSSSTDEQVPSAKVVYDELNERQIKSFRTLVSLGFTDDIFSPTDFGANMAIIIEALPQSGELKCSTGTIFPNISASIMNKINADCGTTHSSSYVCMHLKKYTGTASPVLLEVIQDSGEGRNYKYECIIDNSSTEIKVGTFRCTYNSLERFCSTAVTDAPVTDVALESTKVKLDGTDSIFKYTVINGVCTLSIFGLLVQSDCTYEVLASELPKPVFTMKEDLSTYVDGISGLLWVDTTGTLRLNIGASAVGKLGYATFSYPVAES